MNSRTERQKLGIKKWIKAGGRGTLSYITGFGKTKSACIAIQSLLKQKENAFVLICVPTEVLKNQWIETLIKEGLFLNCKVEIVNTVITKKWENVDLLILDEAHLMASPTFSLVFTLVEYNLILCLTATLKRLDGKEAIIEKYAPVCDTITVEEARENGWISEYKRYKVLIDVDDISEYQELNQQFNLYFAYFDYKFPLAMKAGTDAIYRNKLAKYLGIPAKQFAAICFDWMRLLKKRKDFVMSHPKKFEITRKILNARKDKKCITFSATIKDAEKIGMGYVLHSKQSKKKNAEILTKFNSESTGVLCSSKAADAGVDIKGLSVGIVLSGDSSKIRSTQRLGRTIRMEEDKIAEFFTLCIRGTVDETWFNNSNTSEYITINESQLEKVLNYESFETRQQNSHENLEYRF